MCLSVLHPNILTQDNKSAVISMRKRLTELSMEIRKIQDQESGDG
jgi:hypothetical protein